MCHTAWDPFSGCALVCVTAAAACPWQYILSCLFKVAWGCFNSGATECCGALRTLSFQLGFIYHKLAPYDVALMGVDVICNLLTSGVHFGISLFDMISIFDMISLFDMLSIPR
jgi:uncharacterized membrane protein